MIDTIIEKTERERVMTDTIIGLNKKFKYLVLGWCQFWRAAHFKNG